MHSFPLSDEISCGLKFACVFSHRYRGPKYLILLYEEAVFYFQFVLCFSKSDSSVVLKFRWLLLLFLITVYIAFSV